MMKSWAMALRGGALDIGVAGAGPAEADVLADRVVEENGVLADQRHVVAQAGELDLGDVLSVDEDAAGIDVEEALDERDHRALAAAGGADERGRLAALGASKSRPLNSGRPSSR